MRGDPELWTELGLCGNMGHGAAMRIVLSLGVPNTGFLSLPQIKNEIAVVLSSVGSPQHWDYRASEDSSRLKPWESGIAVGDTRAE